MTIKSVLMIAALAASSVTIAGAKSWNIQVDNTSKAGKLSVPPGTYKLMVKGTTATLQDQDTHKVYTTPVKIDNAEQKYSQTAVVSTRKSGSEMIESIQLGGTTEQIEFTE